ncbi:MAG: hypothetical protein PHF58_10595 [Methylotenera sp.]|nr:hypothetical protein [Methylotenera sp.]
MIENIAQLMFFLGFGMVVLAATFYVFKFVLAAKNPPPITLAERNKQRHRTHLVAIKHKKPKRKFWGD